VAVPRRNSNEGADQKEPERQQRGREDILVDRDHDGRPEDGRELVGAVIAEQLQLLCLDGVLEPKARFGGALGVFRFIGH